MKDIQQDKVVVTPRGIVIINWRNNDGLILAEYIEKLKIEIEDLNQYIDELEETCKFFGREDS